LLQLREQFLAKLLVRSFRQALQELDIAYQMSQAELRIGLWMQGEVTAIR
jgi:hypothetical protein